MNSMTLLDVMMWMSLILMYLQVDSMPITQSVHGLYNACYHIISGTVLILALANVERHDTKQQALPLHNRES